MKHLVSAIVLLVLAGSVQAGGNCQYEREFERVFDASKTNSLTIKAGAGSLEINGMDDSASVTVKARACASSEESLALLDVIYSADSASMETQIPKNDGWRAYSSIDLKVTLPKRLNLDVRDSSGDASVSGVASLVMTDSSGELVIDGVAGNVSVTDSSGGLSLKKIQGDVEVRDSSGEIEASDISGHFTVLVDSSGAIEIQRVAKDVLIKVDSSGAINVRDVGGNFTVGKDGSGRIRYDDVEGDVSLPN